MGPSVIQATAADNPDAALPGESGENRRMPAQDPQQDARTVVYRLAPSVTARFVGLYLVLLAVLVFAVTAVVVAADANPDLLWSGAIGLEATQLLDAMKRIDYVPPRHFYLFPAPGPTVAHPQANGLTSLTWFEDHAPFNQNAGAAEFIALYNERAKAAGLPWPNVDYQAASEFAAWQILEAAAKAVGRLDDKAMAAWLKSNQVSTVLGVRRFDGKFNSGTADTKIKQVQNGKWVTVWPAKFRPPGGSFIAS